MLAAKHEVRLNCSELSALFSPLSGDLFQAKDRSMDAQHSLLVLPSLGEKAAQCGLLAQRIERMARRAGAATREAALRRYRALLEQQERLLDALRAQLRGMEDDEAVLSGEGGRRAEGHATHAP